MNWSLDDLKRLATDCPCGQPHQAIPLEHLEVGPGALANAAAWIRARYGRVVLVMDEHTRAAAGDALAQGLTDLGVLWTACLIEPNAQGDVVADERSIVQALIAAGPDVEALVAVGSGTLHDIARFASYKMRIPFVSVPTAPSVDGFTSAGAPLIVRGIKTTYQTQAPIALFADTDVLERAPRELVWAGFGDVMGKSTSLADWAFGAIAAGEPYCAHLAALTREALEMAVAQADGLARARTDAIRSLMEALILSGIVMLLFGQSHPASGGEHHLSHDWGDGVPAIRQAPDPPWPQGGCGVRRDRGRLSRARGGRGRGGRARGTGAVGVPCGARGRGARDCGVDSVRRSRPVAHAPHWRAGGAIRTGRGTKPCVGELEARAQAQEPLHHASTVERDQRALRCRPVARCCRASVCFILM
ncbi:sn-glycerol-1-phosphate dehydrogenase [Alicyclobacillus acidocaldarius]|uniref:3-dehydroquinate synthase n=1 Tax=Alicyclobacillus acidocaldarius (strain Tc-4-1) TaxID=1048834 RepID=F8IEA2_ALIAT|nr:sn-glycerol-1-phosphate dehydrogenase [Alicyclobacillus acidocaldarius]AEJ45140.1 3-dehydroquinate synthase [Alicyclobacillus acidocaldarius subsp. acidocaldarius Tc-4-1]